MAAAGVIAACIAAHNKSYTTAQAVGRRLAMTTRAEARKLKIYPAQAGGWIYEVWIAARPVVIGWCHTREAALHEATLA